MLFLKAFLNVNKKLWAIQEAEERLTQATSRLAEGEKQLAQAQLVVESIKKDAQTTAQQVKSGILTEGKAEIERLTSTAKSQIGTIESKVRKQISDYVVALALKRVTLQLEGKLNANLQQQIIDRNISKLSD
jgi:F0F1-type ATP synthase membrane subunit b/b'